MKILIAENDRDVLKQYANLLKPRGHDVILTDNGEVVLWLNVISNMRLILAVMLMTYLRLST